MKYESNILLNVFLYEIAVFAVFKYTMKYIILSLLKVNSFINHKEEIRSCIINKVYIFQVKRLGKKSFNTFKSINKKILSNR